MIIHNIIISINMYTFTLNIPAGQTNSIAAKEYPPWESIVLLTTIFTACLFTLPKVLRTIDDAATLEVLTSPLFPHFMTKYDLAYLRLGFAAFIFIISGIRMSFSGYVISRSIVIT